jgi:predicted RecA/RadA family phage recombinase
VAAYGLYNKKGTVTFAGDALGVAIIPPADDVAVATVGVLTVPTAQAAAFLDGTTPRLAADVPKNYGANFSYEEDATAGLTTFKVTVFRVGLTIIFR